MKKSSELLKIFHIVLSEEIFDDLHSPQIKIQSDANPAVWNFLWIERKCQKNEIEKILSLKLVSGLDQQQTHSSFWIDKIHFNFLIRNSSQMFFTLKIISGIDWKNETPSIGINHQKLIAYSKMNLTLEVSVFKEEAYNKLQEISRLRNHSDILEDFQKLWMSSNQSDLKIITQDGNTLEAHKLILCARSKFFNRHFSSIEMKSVEQFTTGFDSNVMKNLLCFIYTEEFSENSHDDHMKLFEAAKLFVIRKLPELCLNVVMKNLNLSNVLKTIQFAEENQLLTLFHRCIIRIQA